MLPFLGPAAFGNPSSAHRFGRTARAGLEQARREVAAAVGAEPSQVVFTSGRHRGRQPRHRRGGARRRARPGGRCTRRSRATEHKAVLAAAHAVVPPGRRPRPSSRWTRDGVVDLEALDRRSLAAKPAVVSVMWVNNEIGTRAAGRGDRGAAVAAAGVLFHTDAVQAFGKLPVSVEPPTPRSLTLSGHKIGAPKGIGALIVRSRTAVEAIIHGGGQQFGIRPGTENVAGAVALGRAAELAAEEQPAQGGAPGRAARRARRAAPRRRARPGGAWREDGPARAARAERGGARRRQRGAADAPRPGGRGRLGRLGLLHRGRRAVARADGDGRAPRTGARHHPVQPGPRDHPGRHRSGGRGVPRASWPRCGSWRGCWVVRERVLVAMSGGVDSSVAAALLVEQGYDVVGATMKLFCYGDSRARPPLLLARLDQRRPRRRPHARHPALRPESRGPLHPARHPELRDGVQPGPHPDSLRPLQLVHQVPRPAGPRRRARLRRYIATGHYAVARDGALYRGDDPAKDQSYFLWGIDRAVVARMLTPVGELTKAETRALARQLGLATADKPESVEICFVPDDDYVGGAGAASARRRAGAHPGPAHHVTGEVIGEHAGLRPLHHRPAPGASRRIRRAAVRGGHPARDARGGGRPRGGARRTPGASSRRSTGWPSRSPSGEPVRRPDPLPLARRARDGDRPERRRPVARSSTRRRGPSPPDSRASCTAPGEQVLGGGVIHEAARHPGPGLRAYRVPGVRRGRRGPGREGPLTRREVPLHRQSSATRSSRPTGGWWRSRSARRRSRRTGTRPGSGCPISGRARPGRPRPASRQRPARRAGRPTGRRWRSSRPARTAPRSGGCRSAAANRPRSPRSPSGVGDFWWSPDGKALFYVQDVKWPAAAGDRPRERRLPDPGEDLERSLLPALERMAGRPPPAPVPPGTRRHHRHRRDAVRPRRADARARRASTWRSPSSAPSCRWCSTPTRVLATSTNNDIFVMGPDGSGRQAITTSPANDNSPALLARQPVHRLPGDDDARLRGRPPAAHALRARHRPAARADRQTGTLSVEAITWTPDSRALIAEVEERGGTTLYRIDVPGGRRTRLVSGGTNHGVRIPPRGEEMVFLRSTADRPTGGVGRQLDDGARASGRSPSSTSERWPRAWT